MNVSLKLKRFGAGCFLGLIPRKHFRSLRCSLDLVSNGIDGKYRVLVMHSDSSESVDERQEFTSRKSAEVFRNKSLNDLLHKEREYPIDKRQLESWLTAKVVEHNGTAAWYELKNSLPSIHQDLSSERLVQYHSTWVCVVFENKKDVENKNEDELEISLSEGWDKHLPAIYKRTTECEPDAENERVSHLHEILAILEHNHALREKQILGIKDWFDPALSHDKDGLADYVGISDRKYLNEGFEAFQKRGTSSGFIKAINDEVRSDTRQEDVFKVDDVNEPLLDAKVRILLSIDDIKKDKPAREASLLGANNMVLLGKTQLNSAGDTEIAGHENLVGRAFLQAHHSQFPTAKEKGALSNAVARHSPAHMQIAIEYVGGTAKLNERSYVGYNVLGAGDDNE